MKKITLLLFFITHLCYAQSDPVFEIPGQIVYTGKTVDVTFVIDRSAFLPLEQLQNSIHYLDENSKMQTLYPKDENVKEIHFTWNGDAVTMIVEKPTGASSKKKFLHLVMDGNVKLYEFKAAYNNTAIRTTTSRTYDPGMIRETKTTTTSRNRAVYYFLQRGQTALFASKEMSFRKQMREYFNDCVPLQNKIDSKEFTADNVPQMVAFYNNKCK